MCDPEGENFDVKDSLDDDTVVSSVSQLMCIMINSSFQPISYTHSILCSWLSLVSTYSEYYPAAIKLFFFREHNKILRKMIDKTAFRVAVKQNLNVTKMWALCTV